MILMYQLLADVSADWFWWDNTPFFLGIDIDIVMQYLLIYYMILCTKWDNSDSLSTDWCPGKFLLVSYGYSQADRGSTTDISSNFLGVRTWHQVVMACYGSACANKPTNWSSFGYGSIPIDTFLMGWTSIYQLFWGSLGTRVLTHPHFMVHYPRMGVQIFRHNRSGILKENQELIVRAWSDFFGISSRLYLQEVQGEFKWWSEKREYNLVGGLNPTPLKNDENMSSSQLGWWHSIPNCFWKNPLKSIKPPESINPNCFWKVIKFHGSRHHQPAIRAAGTQPVPWTPMFTRPSGP